MADWLVDLEVTTVAMESKGGIGFRSMKFWKTTGFMSYWPTHGTPVQYLGERPTLMMYIGFSDYMPVVCCIPASIRIEK